MENKVVYYQLLIPSAFTTLASLNKIIDIFFILDAKTFAIVLIRRFRVYYSPYHSLFLNAS